MTLAVCRYAAIAALAALSAGCAGGYVTEAERASSAHADIRVRTPLVDDDGWPMPADPPPVDAARPDARRAASR